MLLAGKVAVVTGGGSGIGRAICKRLADNGASIVVADVKHAAALDTVKLLGPSQAHIPAECDVSSPEAVNKLKELVGKNGNPVSVLVNCAGITQDSTLLKMPKAKWDSVVGVNLTGVFLVSQAFAKYSVETQSPLSIINVSSIVGKTGNFGQTNYAATKAGVIGFTKSAAKELAKKNVRVNAVLPGFIKTPMTEAMPPQVLAEICSGIPMGRMGEDDEIAKSVLFLASDLSSYVTGAALEVTGGYNM
ncbi:unnamed protein product [Caenorhabditis angaria]|uniref:(3R)-3-hydroxyacyl-CoA dehydrogenase n=1 Tax=Caenorhabditis angaria TaxID=860376 RepID=A0A9P1J3Y8_9PELO|nr:unnamed protein product [Caenorhabditis angaria]